MCLALNALLCAIASAVDTYAVTLDTIKAVGTDRWTSASFSPFECAPPLFLFSLTVSLPNPYYIIEYRASANLPPSLSEGIVITGTPIEKACNVANILVLTGNGSRITWAVEITFQTR